MEKNVHLLDDIGQIVTLLESGAVAAIPTETVYGLAALMNKESALQNIFKIKERPLFDPLIVHCKDLESAKELCSNWPKSAQVLAEKFWPGPLTLVLEKKPDLVSDLITAGLPTVGLRVPAHPLTRQLLQKISAPLAAPSANKFKQTSPTRAEHVLSGLPGVPVLQGGACQVGVESTILQIFEESANEVQLALLRPGMVSASQISQALGLAGINCVWKTQNEKLKSTLMAAPGMLADHYCSRLPLILTDSKPNAFFDQVLCDHKLFPTSEVVLAKESFLAARELYQQLHREVAPKVRSLYFVQPENWESEEWAPLNDRLSKASSFIYNSKFPSKLNLKK